MPRGLQGGCSFCNVCCCQVFGFTRASWTQRFVPGTIWKLCGVLCKPKGICSQMRLNQHVLQISCLHFAANKYVSLLQLVENITPKPPSMEKNIKLLEEIASEFTLRWDSRGFEERMASSSMTEQVILCLLNFHFDPYISFSCSLCEYEIFCAINSCFWMDNQLPFLPSLSELELQENWLINSNALHFIPQLFDIFYFVCHIICRSTSEFLRLPRLLR